MNFEDDPAILAETAAIMAEHAARRQRLRDAAEAVYLPDGSPVAGPITTAAERACWLGRGYPQDNGAILERAITEWRNAAGYEAAQYSRALQCANAYRRLQYAADSYPERTRAMTRATTAELRRGSPAPS